MDFLLVVSEWLDMGFTGIGLLLGVILYRRRALVTDTLWWIREKYRLEALLSVIRAMQNTCPEDVDGFIDEFEARGQHKFTEADRYAARCVCSGIKYQHKGLEDETHEDSAEEMRTITR